MEEKKTVAQLFAKLFEDIDKDRIRSRVKLLKEGSPGWSREALCNLEIDKEATQLALIGAGVGLLPWPWSILGIAPDLIALLSKESTLVLTIALLHDRDPEAEERAYEVLGCLGASVGAVAGTYGIKRLLERRMEERLIKALIDRIWRGLLRRSAPVMAPVVGALAGGAFNYLSVKAVGTLALEYYKSREKEESAEEPQGAEDAGTPVMPDARESEEKKADSKESVPPVSAPALDETHEMPEKGVTKKDMGKEGTSAEKKPLTTDSSTYGSIDCASKPRGEKEEKS
jgi:hypothetical protein